MQLSCNELTPDTVSGYDNCHWAASIALHKQSSNRLAFVVIFKAFIRGTVTLKLFKIFPESMAHKAKLSRSLVKSCHRTNTRVYEDIYFFEVPSVRSTSKTDDISNT